ncbi:MAG: zinc ribbon domain-containing protein [Spirochaetaceae bacterium]|nr:zinc ribbon domain-containing protein [Spirochaetaceae bacterium]
MKCPQCETELEEGLNFCPHCQAKLNPEDDGVEKSASATGGGKKILSPRFFNNFEYINLLCLLQSIDGEIDSGIQEMAEFIIDESEFKNKINVISPGDISYYHGKMKNFYLDITNNAYFKPHYIELSNTVYVDTVTEIISNTLSFTNFAKKRNVGDDDMCDLFMSTLYEAELGDRYPFDSLLNYISISLMPISNRDDLSAWRDYFDDIVLGLLEYVMTNDIYTGGNKRFIQHFARRWRISASQFTILENIAAALAGIEKQRQKITESDEPYKQVQKVLAELAGQEGTIIDKYEALKINGLSSSGGIGYGLDLIDNVSRPDDFEDCNFMRLLKV